MGLEGQNDPLITHAGNGLQKRVDLAGMVRIVIVDIRPVAGAFIFQPSTGAVETAKPPADRSAANAQYVRGSGSGQRVIDIMVAVDLQINVRI